MGLAGGLSMFTFALDAARESNYAKNVFNSDTPCALTHDLAHAYLPIEKPFLLLFSQLLMRSGLAPTSE
jgi:hypothetical protein